MAHIVEDGEEERVARDEDDVRAAVIGELPLEAGKPGGAGARRLRPGERGPRHEEERGSGHDGLL